MRFATRDMTIALIDDDGLYNVSMILDIAKHVAKKSNVVPCLNFDYTVHG